jgi:choice-of-anchor A domain-containing protein
MNKFLLLLITLFVSAFLSTQVSAVAIDLGAASQYSVFMKNDFKVTSSDTEARIAVGGDFIVAGQYDVGAELHYMGLGGGPRLVVGGNIVKTTSASFNVYGDGLTAEGLHSGEIVYAGKALNNGTEITSGVNGNFEATLTKVSKADLPVEFDNAFSHLDKLSTDLMSATEHGKAHKTIGWDGKEVDWGPLIFEPTTESSDNIYVFNVTQEQINSDNEWDVRGVNADATIVFNLSNENNIAGKTNNSGGECAEGQIGCIQLSQVNLSINGVLASSNFIGKGHGVGNSKGAWLNNTKIK